MVHGTHGRRAEAVIPVALGAAGLAVIVVGTFLPWLRSGSADRNSYAAGGAVRRLVDTSGMVNDVLSLWPLVSVACAVAVALFLVGLRAVGTVVAAISALGAGVAGVAALATTTTSVAEVVLVGPLCTVVGAALVALGILFRALSAAATPGPPRTEPPHPEPRSNQ